MKPHDDGYTRQLALIRDHLDAMCDDALAEELGATKDRALHVRVLRYLDHLNDVRESLRECERELRLIGENAVAPNPAIALRMADHARKVLGKEPVPTT